MTTTLRKTIVAVTLGACALVGPLAGVAGATDPPSGARLDAVKQFCDSKIDQRVDHLARLTTRVNELKHLPDDAKATITATLSTTSSTLDTTARAAVDGATDRESLKTACRAIVLDYRVYVLLTPQVFVAAGSDSAQAVAVDLSDATAALREAGIDTSAPDAKIADAQAKASGAEAAVGSLTPADYNADPAGTTATLDTARSDVRAAVSELREAKKMIEDLAQQVH